MYELDGLQHGPIVVGSFEESPKINGEENSLEQTTSFDMDSLTWLQVARAAIQERMERYAVSEIKFNLMAVVRDKRSILQQRLKQLTEQAGVAEDDPSVQDLNLELMNEEEKRRSWERENQRRRHNYIPFCVELLKALAASGKLPQMTDEARQRVAAKKRKLDQHKLTK